MSELLRDYKHHYKVWYYYTSQYGTNLTAYVAYHYKDALKFAESHDAEYIERCNCVDGEVIFNSWRRVWEKPNKD